jgi:hypothetical protein
MVLPAQPPAGPPVPAAVQASVPQVVVNLTPVIFVNISIPSEAFQPPAAAVGSPSPVPTRDRWARIESPPMPLAQAQPATHEEPTTLVLAAPPQTTNNEGTLRWIARFAMLSVGALVLRWSLR